MATQAQILANRRNSEKSTGPRTAEGKATVAKNATKHGLFARMDVVISENQADFDAFRDDMLAELAPAGTMESILAARIVSLTWRLQRAERMQNELIDVKIRREINDTRPELSESLITGKPCDLSKYSDKCYDDLALGYVAMCGSGCRCTSGGSRRACSGPWLNLRNSSTRESWRSPRLSRRRRFLIAGETPARHKGGTPSPRPARHKGGTPSPRPARRKGGTPSPRPARRKGGTPSPQRKGGNAQNKANLRRPKTT